MKYDYKFIGWCKEDNHDKVWGIIKLNEIDRWQGTYVTFWGRRGAKLQTKISQDDKWKMQELSRTKQRKGYREIELSELDKVYPEFESDVEKVAFWSMLKV